MGLVNQFAKSILTACLPRRRLLVQGAPASRSAVAADSISLTFDDGPDPQYIGDLLDALREADVVATFFVIGEKARRHPEVISRIVNEGHELGNHTMTHSEPGRTSPQQFLAEVAETSDVLERLTGSRPVLVRPPKGELSLAKIAGLWQRGYVPVLWNVDTKDYRMQQPEEMKAWCQSWAPQSGDIVLMHDNHPFAAAAIRELNRLGVWNRFHTVPVSRWIDNAVAAVGQKR